MRARILMAAAVMACGGAVASCAAPASPRTIGAHSSQVAVEAAPVWARPMWARPAAAVRIRMTRPASSPSPSSQPVPVAALGFSGQQDSILGVYTSGVPTSYSRVDSFAREVGTQPNVVMYFSAWGDRFRTGFAQVARSRGAVPFVELEPYTVSMQSIAAGQQDAYLWSYARAVRSFGGPVLIGFAHEMNGFWYRWGYTHTPPQVFRSAWRHVVTIFRRAGADNVKWVWVINGLAPGESPISEWWPGAQYVTWVAMDGYYVRPSQTFSSVFGPTIRALRDLTSKPEMIAEVGIGSTVGRASKVPGLLAGIRATHLLGLVYYDKAQHNGQYHQDWQIDYDRPALAALRDSIKRYLR